MAIKILKEGDPTKAPTYVRTCPECGCEFSYKYKDTFESARRGGYVMVFCPCCNYAVAHIGAGNGYDMNKPSETGLPE